ncbi:putative 50 kDa protein in type I retrotransposable element R1DM [Operophtera brumata]|uniref:Putative 50 kDa protein in type I retrotransposable element R1DM n=1 Tax=Operophtera brumata TaxID=104452 RepID=A0A0L7L5Y8_OPEBR|nr:putative 50 kDa protein in type I retrotransposable element R1DM [Operophtera brumata]
MSVALKDLDVRVVRPVKMGELRLKDLDDSVTPQKVQTAVATSGDYSVINVRVGDIRRSPTALGTVWVRCPLVSVRKLAAAKHVVVGWVSARVDYLTSMPLQCFRCIEYGHVRSMCQGTVDRSTLCYACGKPGHRASQCTDPHRCLLCLDKGCKADHRMGSKKCTPPKVRPGASSVEVTKRGKKGRPAVTSVPSQGTQSQARAKRQRKPAKGGKDKMGQPRLRAPTSSAIVLTIQSKGAEGGLTYVKALTEARHKVDLASLGITSALGFRQAVTGARMLEVPGEDSGPKADALAEKLRELFDEDILRVTRPVKCAELRVAGLDDSVTETDVVEAIA